MNIAYCLTGSFCTFSKSIEALKELVESGHNVTPVMSENAYAMDTRFGKAKDLKHPMHKFKTTIINL